MDDALVIAGKRIRSRLFVGTGKYRTVEEMQAALEASGAEIVTVAIRRLNLDRPNEKTLLDYINWDKYTLLPNEEVLSLLGAAGFNPTQVYRSRGGNAIHAQVLEDKTDRNTHEIVEGDSVKVGVMVRNSIDGSLAFGGDIFTYRLLCSNGAIARGAEVGSFTYKHLGEREKLTAGVKDMIERVLNAGTELIATYRMAAEISLNQQFADQLAKTYIPDVYIPKYIDMKDRTKPKLTAAAQSVSLWQAFNYMTKEMWHPNRASMITKMRHEQELHKVLTIAVRGRN